MIIKRDWLRQHISRTCRFVKRDCFAIARNDNSLTVIARLSVRKAVAISLLLTMKKYLLDLKFIL